MDNQIQEMAKDMCEYYYEGTCYQDKKPCDLRCESMTDAQYLYAKGYRKASEVALGVISEIQAKIQIMVSSIKAQEEIGNISEFNGGAKTALEMVFKDIAELEKKYTEGGE